MSIECLGGQETYRGVLLHWYREGIHVARALRKAHERSLNECVVVCARISTFIPIRILYGLYLIDVNVLFIIHRFVTLQITTGGNRTKHGQANRTNLIEEFSHVEHVQADKRIPQ